MTQNVVRLTVKSRKNSDRALTRNADTPESASLSRLPIKGRFQRGQSGNPNGRPRGTANLSHAQLRTLLSENAEAIIRRVIEAAIEGDMVAARLILDRVLPRRVCRPTMELNIPSLRSPADAVTAMTEIVAAATDGRITPLEATELGAAVEAFIRIVSTSDLVAKMDSLEEQLKELRQ